MLSGVLWGTAGVQVRNRDTSMIRVNENASFNKRGRSVRTNVFPRVAIIDDDFDGFVWREFFPENPTRDFFAKVIAKDRERARQMRSDTREFSRARCASSNRDRQSKVTLISIYIMAPTRYAVTL